MIIGDRPGTPFAGKNMGVCGDCFPFPAPFMPGPTRTPGACGTPGLPLGNAGGLPLGGEQFPAPGLLRCKASCGISGALPAGRVGGLRGRGFTTPLLDAALGGKNGTSGLPFSDEVALSAAASLSCAFLQGALPRTLLASLVGRTAAAFSTAAATGGGEGCGGVFDPA